MKPAILAGPEIAEWRNRIGYPAKDLAKHVGIDTATLSRIETGKQRPSFALSQLVRVFLTLKEMQVDQKNRLDSILFWNPPAA